MEIDIPVKAEIADRQDCAECGKACMYASLLDGVDPTQVLCESCYDNVWATL